MSRTTDWLARIYELHREGMFRAAWNILHCENLAEDAVHMAFCRLSALDWLPEEPKTYVYRAVRNAAIDIRRQRARLNEEGLSDDIPFDCVEILADARMESLEYAMRILDDSTREIIELHLHSGLTFREIGVITGVPLQTIASRYRRALLQMRTELELNKNG